MINKQIADFEVPVIGVHHSPLSQKFGTPRQPNLVNISTKIEMLPPFSNLDAFAGIEAFSHLWIQWIFHHNYIKQPQKSAFTPSVRPPRLGGNKKVGVFATRSMYRPSNMGLSVVQLQGYEVIEGKVWLHIIGADMIDQTPIVDIKPYIAYSDAIVDATSGFAMDKPTTKTVIIDESILPVIDKLVEQNSLNKEDIEVIKQLISQDPRPAYKQNQTDTSFYMRYKACDVAFYMTPQQTLIINDVCLCNNS